MKITNVNNKNQNYNLFILHRRPLTYYYIYFILLSLVLLTSSCLSINYDHITEKFRDYERVDFNRINTINIITNDKTLFNITKDYILKFYRYRGLYKAPEIKMQEQTQDSGDQSLNIYMKNFDYNITTGWKEVPRENDIDGKKIIVHHNNVEYWKTISISYKIVIFKYTDVDQYYDLTGDINDKITDDWAFTRTYYTDNVEKMSDFGIPSAEDIANLGLKDILERELMESAIGKIFNDFFSERLFLTNREIHRFKLGFNFDFLEAHRKLKSNDLTSALIIWESLFSDIDMPLYARGVAAYNIAVVHTINKEYADASKYFKLSDQLMEEGMYEIRKF